MKARFLFPYQTRYLGWVLVFIHLPVMHLWAAFHHPPINVAENTGIFNSHHLYFMGTMLMVMVGLMLVAFSKEKIEDEQISQLRQDCLQWAIYLNYLLLTISLIFFTEKADVKDILNMNLWVPLAFFIILFRWKMYQLNRLLSKEGN
jgi:uncharacterized membrane protein YiaA